MCALSPSADIAQVFATQGVDPAHGTPRELSEYMRAETTRWSRVIRTAGIRLEN